MPRHQRLLVPFVALALIAGATALPLRAQDIAPRLTVTGTGEVGAAPDLARFDAGATAEAATAAAALAATSAAMTDIRAVLDGAGIAPADIRTTALSLSPVWSNSYGSGSGKPRITGFQARNQVTVTLRDLAALGPLLDDLATAGANQLGTIRFDLSDEAAALDAARVAAVADARRKAALYAGAAGVTLGPLIRLAEGTPRIDRPMMAEMALAADSRGVPVSEGTLTLRADVTLVYAIGE